MKNAWGVVTQDEWSSLPLKERTKRKRRLAKEMKRNPTPAEARLLVLLQTAFPFGYWTPQRLLCGYIADVASDALHMVVEADGSAHNGREDYDAFRDGVLSEDGWRVVRFKNEEILDDRNHSLICDRIVNACDIKLLEKLARRWEKRESRRKKNRNTDVAATVPVAYVAVPSAKVDADSKEVRLLKAYKAVLTEIVKHGCVRCSELASEVLRYEGPRPK